MTLPARLERDAVPTIQFWFVTFDALRSELFPRLKRAYRSLCSGDSAPLRDAMAVGREHWGRVCGQVLALDRDRGAGAEQAIARLLETSGVRL